MQDVGRVGNDPNTLLFLCFVFLGWGVVDNYIHDMQDAGIAIMESMDAKIYDNTIENVRYGIRISLGGAGNEIYDNTFDDCSAGEPLCLARLRKTPFVLGTPNILPCSPQTTTELVF